MKAVQTMTTNASNKKQQKLRNVRFFLKSYLATPNAVKQKGAIAEAFRAAM